MAPDPDGLVLGVLSPTMFIEWMRAIGSRIKSNLRFSNTFVCNTFPLPTLTHRQREALIGAAVEIVQAKGRYPTWSLAAFYEPANTPTDLLQAHKQVDRVVDKIFGARPDMTPDDRQRLLFVSMPLLPARKRGNLTSTLKLDAETQWFVMDGGLFDLTANEVRARLAGKTPGSIQEHWVEINGVPGRCWRALSGEMLGGWCYHGPAGCS